LSVPQIGYSRRPVALGREGLVASAHPFASLSGLEVLKSGGGVSIAGGKGRVLGCILGAAFLVIILNSLPMIDVSPFWQMAISGAAILAAVIVNSRAEAPRGTPILPRQGAAKDTP